MEGDHENHLATVIDWISDAIDTKYRKGQQEHGGRMWEKPGMLACMIEEAVDQAVYLKTVADQIRRRDPKLYSFLMTPGDND